MKAVKCLFLVILVFLIYSCNNNEPKPKQTISYKKINEPNLKQAIRDLVERFPQLSEGKNVRDRSFGLVRTVIDGKTGVKIQLYSQDEGIKNRNQIIVFVNTNNKCIAIPLFNNRQRDYWQFTNEKTVLNVAKVNTTFENEFSTAISILKRENSFKYALFETSITKELFQSTLHTQFITSWNRSLEMCKIKHVVSDIPVENEDDVRERFEKNYQDIEKGLINAGSYFYDGDNHRVYKINYNEKENKFIFKNYRQDFGDEPIKPMYL